jgi:hypothetical protein
MLGIISSTIFPGSEPLYWGSPRNCIPSGDRLAQTRETIASLLTAGISEIILVDNSGSNWVEKTQEQLQPANVYVFDQYQFQNKGISEILLLLNSLRIVPSCVPILKVSGRYVLKQGFALNPGDADLGVKLVKSNDGTLDWVSTRCYWTRDKQVLANFLRSTLMELYGGAAKIRSPRSVLRLMRNTVFPKVDNYPYHDPPEAIEGAAARVVRRTKYKVRFLETIGVEGISGDNDRKRISE